MGKSDIFALIAISIAVITLLYTYILTVKTIKRNHYDNFFNSIIKLFVLISTQITLSQEENSKLFDKKNLDHEMAYIFYNVRSQYRIYIEQIVSNSFPIKEIDNFLRETINIANSYMDIIDKTDEESNIKKEEMKTRIDEIQSIIGEMYIKHDVFKSRLSKKINNKSG